MKKLSFIAMVAALVMLSGCAGGLKPVDQNRTIGNEKQSIAERSAKTKAQQTISSVGVPATLGAYRTANNAELAKIEANTGELYTLKADKSCFATESAFNACFDLTWSTGGTSVTDATITTTDVTTNNASTSKHGWMVKATAPSSGLRNVVAIDNGETAYTNKALFDATSPSTQTLGDSAVVGTAMTAARRDHKHAMPSAQTATTTAFTPNGSIAATTVQAAIQEVRDESGSGVSLSTANTWTALQTFSNGISASSIASSATDGAHYLDIVNGVAITAIATLGRIAYYNGRMRLADGTDWDGYFLEDTDLGSGVGTMLAIAPGSAGGPTTTIASGTSALGTGAISSGSCASVVTTSATNAATTDVINWGFNSSPAAVAGYAASVNGMLTIIAYPSSGNVNFLVCNNTASSITPGAITLNWRIQR